MIEKFLWRTVNYKLPNSASAKPCPRWGHSSCTIGNQVVLFGGYAQSVYMNDLWVFNTQTMEWSEIKTTGPVPSPRSNCSVSYDNTNNRIIFFGGGGPNKSRFNCITLLDWKTKTWSELNYSENQTVLWERTYHTAQLVYPYLVVFGGEGIADLDDLWVFNFETKTWMEIPIGKNQARPCGRRFHSSCVVGNQFYVIAGCHTKYRCLNDIYSIDLTSLIATGEVTGLQWQQKGYKGTALLSRWGHSSTTLGDKIYIFGGRFSTDLNDLLVYDTCKGTLGILKASQQSLPKPRRRPSACFVGSCLLMFGGFNSEYYNDLNYINVAQNRIKSKNLLYNEFSEVSKASYIKQLLNKNCENYIKSSEQDLVPLHRDLLSAVFEDEQKLDDFLLTIDGQICTSTLRKVMQSLYLGYGKLDILNKFNVELPQDQQEKLRNTRRSFQEKVLGLSSITGLTKTKNSLGIIELDDEHFGEIIQKNRQNIKKNVTLVINNQYMLDSNSNILSLNNKYFRALFSQKYSDRTVQKTQKQSVYSINLASNNIVIFQIVINCLINGLLVIPRNMSAQSWVQMYEMADYFCINHLKQVCIYQISTKIDQSSVNRIFTFSKNQGIDDLAECCAKFKIRITHDIQEQYLSDRHMKKIYNQNKFEIMQKVMENPEPKLIKHKSELTNSSQGQKENYEFCN